MQNISLAYGYSLRCGIIISASTYKMTKKCHDLSSTISTKLSKQNAFVRL